jgi:hypothetical protein
MPARYLATTLGIFVVATLVRGQDKPVDPVVPTEPIKLFNGKDFTGLTTWLKNGKREDPKKVFSVVDGTVYATGQDVGYIGTDKAYKDYHLVVEYKWGKETYGAKGARNSGVLLHGVGPDGGAGGVWLSCIECQLAQGCVGDLIVIRGKDEKGELVPVRFLANTAFGPDKRLRWKAGGEAREFTKGQLWWSDHEPFFKEEIDTRGKNDPDSPLGEWTKIECVCAGNRITVKVNGKTVNECYDCFPAAGRILLQTEGFDIQFRNFELLPLKKDSKKE